MFTPDEGADDPAMVIPMPAAMSANSSSATAFCPLAANFRKWSNDHTSAEAIKRRGKGQ
jgi:hypothetical protein